MHWVKYFSLLMHWVKYFSPSIQCEEYFSLQIHWFKYFVQMFFCMQSRPLWMHLSQNMAWSPNICFPLVNNQYQAFPSWWLLRSMWYCPWCLETFLLIAFIPITNFLCHLILIAFVITLLLKYTLIFSFLSYILLRVNCVSGQIISK